MAYSKQNPQDDYRVRQLPRRDQDLDDSEEKIGAEIKIIIPEKKEEIKSETNPMDIAYIPKAKVREDLEKKYRENLSSGMMR